MEKGTIKKILVISLTNIGDVILTFPVIDILRGDFPEAHLSVVIGPKAEGLLARNPHINNIDVYDKHQSPWKTCQWLWQLRREHYDLIVDLRNSAIPFLIGSRYGTSPFMKRARGQHMRWQHLSRLKSVYPYADVPRERRSFYISSADQRRIDRILREAGLEGHSLVAVGPGAADEKKRWMEDGFAEVCQHLVRHHRVGIVLVGDRHDRPVAERIKERMAPSALNICGDIDLKELGYLLTRCRLAIVNDSAPMHLASYLNVPVLAIFGPTSPITYGPWSENGCYLHKPQQCPACQGTSREAAHSCMRAIDPRTVLQAIPWASAEVRRP
jgi:lipopolysaccharide heptosyltransferase II